MTSNEDGRLPLPTAEEIARDPDLALARYEAALLAGDPRVYEPYASFEFAVASYGQAERIARQGATDNRLSSVTRRSLYELAELAAERNSVARTRFLDHLDQTAAVAGTELTFDVSAGLEDIFAWMNQPGERARAQQRVANGFLTLVFGEGWDDVDDRSILSPVSVLDEARKQAKSFGMKSLRRKSARELHDYLSERLPAADLMPLRYVADRLDQFGSALKGAERAGAMEIDDLTVKALGAIGPTVAMLGEVPRGDYAQAQYLERIVACAQSGDVGNGPGLQQFAP